MAEKGTRGSVRVDGPPAHVVDVEANEILQIEEDQFERGELIGQPEVGEAHAKERRADHTSQRFQEPETRVLVERVRGIEEKEEQQSDETERLNERMEIEVRRKNEARETQEPEDEEKGADLEELLVGEVMTRVNFEDENVIDTRR